MRETGLKNLMLNKFLGVFRKFDNLDEVKIIFLKNHNFKNIRKVTTYRNHFSYSEKYVFGVLSFETRRRANEKK